MLNIAKKDTRTQECYLQIERDRKSKLSGKDPVNAKLTAVIPKLTVLVTPIIIPFWPILLFPGCPQGHPHATAVARGTCLCFSG